MNQYSTDDIINELQKRLTLRYVEISKSIDELETQEDADNSSDIEDLETEQQHIEDALEALSNL